MLARRATINIHSQHKHLPVEDMCLGDSCEMLCMKEVADVAQALNDGTEEATLQLRERMRAQREANTAP